MKKIFYICLLIGVTSCVSKSKFEELESDYQTLQLEKQDLESQLSNLQVEYYEIKLDYDKIVEAKRREEIERNEKKYISESEALAYVKDYYNFSKSSQTPTDIKLKRTDKNSFFVSLTESLGMGIIENKDVIYHLRVNNDNTYSLMRTAY